MISVLLLGIAACALAGVAGFFSVIGLAEFAAAAATPIMVFGSILEISKLIATGFLHYYWHEAPRHLKWPGVAFIATIMLVTMMGIYGFISAAHFNQNTPLQAVQMQVVRIDQQISASKEAISRYQTRLTQMDDMVNGFIGNDKVSNASSIRDKQRRERAEVEGLISEANLKIDALETKKLELHQSVASVEAKLGPAKSAARMFNIDETGAVNIFIIMLMIPFDPFAVWLVIATTYAYKKHLTRKQEQEISRQSEREEDDKRKREQRELQIKQDRENAEWADQLEAKKIERQMALERSYADMVHTVDEALHHQAAPSSSEVSISDIVPAVTVDATLTGLADTTNSNYTPIVEPVGVQDDITTGIIDIIRNNPAVIDDLKAAIGKDSSSPVVDELEKILSAMDTSPVSVDNSWIGGRPSTKKPFVTGIS